MRDDDDVVHGRAGQLPLFSQLHHFDLCTFVELSGGIVETLWIFVVDLLSFYCNKFAIYAARPNAVDLLWTCSGSVYNNVHNKTTRTEA